jgi:DNA invertase Pin-like site-specific DNA recombinase
MPATHPTRILGYARVSSHGQELDYQLAKLNAEGCTRIYHEKESGKNTDDRLELGKLLKAVEPGDLVLATATDRLARDPVDTVNILRTIANAGAHLRLIDEPFIDTRSEFADLIVFMMGWAARMHRIRILENTARGRKAARTRGVKFGRRRGLCQKQIQAVEDLRKRGTSVRQIAREFNVSESTIYRLSPWSDLSI